MKKILVCDDDKSILDIIRIVLEDEGFEVHTLAATDDIFGFINNIKPDLLLIDLWIPGPPTKKIVQKIKSMNKNYHFPVVLISANRRLEIACENMGADACLAKPFDISTLSQQVKSLLKI